MADTQDSRTSGFELRDYFRVLWLRKWTAFFVMALVVGGVLFLSYRQIPVYAARAKVLVPEQGPTIVGTVQVSRPKLNLETEAGVAASPAIAERVKEPCPSFGERSDMSDAQLEVELARCDQMEWAREIDAFNLARIMKVAPLKATNFLQFEAENPDPVKAFQLVHWFAVEYIQFRGEQNAALYEQPIAQVEQQIKSLRTQLNALDPEATDLVTQNQIVSLNQQIASLQVDRQALIQAREASTAQAGTIVSDAQIPMKPVSPDHVRNGILAAIVGLALGIGAAFLRDYVDDSLRGVDDVERQSGAPLIGVIPHVSGKMVGKDGREHLVSLEDPKAPATEAYRTLRTNIQFLAVSGPVRRLVITSPVLGEGKSTTAANLAAVMAQAGQRVLLVGTDLRRPSVHRFLGLSNRVGLSSMLAGQASLAEAVQSPGVKGLRVMSGGPVPPNPAELLGSQAMKEFLAEAGRVTDWVILDAPPVLGLADASVLSTLADAVLMVVNEGTNRRILAHARDQLQKVDARVVGTVLNNFGSTYSYYYSDYYAYTSTYYQQPEPEGERASRRARRRERKEERRRAKRGEPAPDWREEEPAVSGNGGGWPTPSAAQREAREEPASPGTSRSSEGFFFK
ncbi:MAG: polysaccharide biosynthesis tyrosine autokinase [Actinobacteria bacterium]|nr:polysaccharide biosynthesis tyrosine autokinase [Actinomycetota bacterium]